MNDYDLENLRIQYEVKSRKCRRGLMFSYVLISLIAFFGIIFAACAQEPPPHVIKGYMTGEDADYWYHLQTLSNGSNNVHKVRKPPPPNPYISRQIIATNNLPVQVQYTYRVLLQDLTVITNTVTRTKTARERTHITLPPAPEYIPPEPGKTDALGQALKIKRTKKQLAMRKVEEEVEEYKMMARPDRIISRKVVDGRLQNLHQSGKVTISELKRVHTARVKSAPTEFDWPKDAKPEDFSYIGDPDKPNQKGKNK